MAGKPEERARAEIDRLLEAAGWSVQDVKAANIHATQGVALREFKLNDCALYFAGYVGRAASARAEFERLLPDHAISFRIPAPIPPAPFPPASAVKSPIPRG